MAQATYVPNVAHDNAEALAFFQNVFAAIASNNLGATAPTETFAGMFWVDTSGGGYVLRQRNAANNAWVKFLPDIADFNQTEWITGTAAEVASISPLLLAGTIDAALASRAYNYQEFLASGTWTKPANAEAGDKVIVQAIGGGQAGGYTGGSGSSVSTVLGGEGGRGLIYAFDNIDDLSATESVSVGAAGLGGLAAIGSSGGNTTFGTASTEGYLIAQGGGLGAIPQVYKEGALRPLYSSLTIGGANGQSSWFGGAGGGNSSGRNDPRSGPDGSPGMASANGSVGGDGRTFTDAATAGTFPGGGGGASALDNAASGAGAPGVVRVWCIRES